jgi:hypothetical protein
MPADPFMRSRGPDNEKPGEGRLGTASRGRPPAVAVTVRSRVGRGVGAAVDRFVDRRFG